MAASPEEKKHRRVAVRAAKIKRVPILKRTRRAGKARDPLLDNKLQAGRLDRKAKDLAQDTKPDRDALAAACRQICTAHGVPLTPSLMSNLCLFYDQRLKKLEYLNEQMVRIYASAFVYRNSRSLKKEIFARGIKREIFGKALLEVDSWTKEQEPMESMDSLVCNLYSIVGK